MARGFAADGKGLDLTRVERAQAKWAVLQLRQYQRACFEAFYVALEYLLSGAIEIPDRSKAGVIALMGMFCEGSFAVKKNSVVADIEDVIREAGREICLIGLSACGGATTEDAAAKETSRNREQG